jgi:hypothetical protein
MKYKSIVHEILQDRPQLHEQLRRQRMLLRTLEELASALKSSHEAWKRRLRQSRPDSDESRIASEAGEIALQELLDSLPGESPRDDASPFSLDAAMAFITRHTPPA